jgi:hypothetical protein
MAPRSAAAPEAGVVAEAAAGPSLPAVGEVRSHAARVAANASAPRRWIRVDMAPPWWVMRADGKRGPDGNAKVGANSMDQRTCATRKGPEKVS